MKNVWIFLDVGGTYGLGHYHRAVELALAFLTEGSTVKLLGDFAQVKIDQRLQVSWRTIVDGHRLPFLKSHIQSGQSLPDICVFDVKKFSEQELNLLRNDSVTVAVGDNTDDFSSDIIITTKLSSITDEVKRNGLPFNLCGVEYLIINEHYFKKNPAINNRLLISFGGEDPKNYSSKVMDFLERNKFQKPIELVIGPFFSDKKTIIQKAKASKLDIALHDAPDNLIDIANRCQFAISACGTTAYELAAAKILMYLIAVEDHQIPLRKEFVERELGFSTQAKIELDDELLHDALRFFKDPIKGEIVLGNLNKTFVKPGQKKLVEEILQYRR